ncbi:MAG: DinB family protein [Gemmatimonadaceae bacterium]|nr:DinB family protein [Gemmatimonadaceae bacterium]
MHPRLEAVIEHADRARLDLLAALDTIPPGLQEARPSEDAWSAAEVLEHLCRVEKGVTRLTELKAAELRGMAAVPMEGPEMVPVNVERFRRLPDRSSRIMAPDRVQPTGEVSAVEARAALLEHRRSLLSQLRQADGLALSTVSHPHPVFGDLDLYEWVYTIGGHELRHAAQLREIAAHFANA